MIDGIKGTNKEVPNTLPIHSQPRLDKKNVVGTTIDSGKALDTEEDLDQVIIVVDAIRSARDMGRNRGMISQMMDILVDLENGSWVGPVAQIYLE